MADQVPISGLTSDITPLLTDLIPVVDTTDHTEAPTGTTKKMTRNIFITGLLQSDNNLSDVGNIAGSNINLGSTAQATNIALGANQSYVSANPLAKFYTSTFASANQTFILPNMTQAHALNTNNSGFVTIYNAGTNTFNVVTNLAATVIATIAPGDAYNLYCTSNASQDGQWLTFEAQTRNPTFNSVIINGNLTFIGNDLIRTSTVNSDSLSFQAYSSVASAYVTLGFLTNGTSGSLTFSKPANGLLSWVGGTIDNSAIGLTTPATAIFSNLSWPIRQSPVNSNTQVNAASDLCTTFIVQTSGIIMSTAAYGTYQTSFQFNIKNATSGNISYTPNSGETIEGLTTLTIQPGECFTIAKSATTNQWIGISSFNTFSGSDIVVASYVEVNTPNNTFRTIPYRVKTVATSSSEEPLAIATFSTAHQNNVDFYVAGGTEASPTVVSSNDGHNMLFWGWDGSAFSQLGQFSAYVNGTVSSGIVPGAFSLQIYQSDLASVSSIQTWTSDGTSKIFGSLQVAQSIVSTSYTVTVKDATIAVSISTAAITITMPNSPKNNQRLTIYDRNCLCATHNITVAAGSGQTLVTTTTGNSTFIMNANGQSTDWLYDSSNSTWKLV